MGDKSKSIPGHLVDNAELINQATKLMAQKIRNIQSHLDLEIAKHHKLCTMMVIHDLFEIFWMPIPCEAKILDVDSIVCMARNKTDILYSTDNYKMIYSQSPWLFHLVACKSGMYVSMLYVCSDVSQSCDMAHQGQFCKELHGYQSLCKTVSHLNFSFMDSVCPETREIIRKKDCHHPLRGMQELSIDITQDSEYHDANNKCIFERNPCGEILHNSNGKHLLNCDDYQCDMTYFKCPRYYCIPWRQVCNGKVDCPGGVDESKAWCTRTSCPGQFRCHDSITCLHVDNTCDKVTDCKHGDDEFFCFPPIPKCPKNCKCFLYSISCKNLETSIEKLFPTNDSPPYISILLFNATISNLASLLHKFNQSISVSLKKANITTLCSALKLGMPMNYLDIAENNVTKMYSNCITNASFLITFNISYNKLKNVPTHTFNGSQCLSSIDLSHNSIVSLESHCFRGLTNLSVLNLTGNLLEEFDSTISSSIFGGSHVKNILTTDYEL